MLELKSTTLALAPDVLPVTILLVSKNVGSTKVIDGRIGSESSSDSYTACILNTSVIPNDRSTSSILVPYTPEYVRP